MKPSLKIAALSLLMLSALCARDFHVATTGDDSSDGSSTHPLRTIQAAANQAMPGDMITVREGVYRERIDPPCGGDSDAKRIIYQAAPGAKVTIKGSEVVNGWTKVAHDTRKVVIPNSFFESFNPFADEIRGDWFKAKGRKHHTGAIYQAGHWLTEAAKPEEVLEPATTKPAVVCHSR
jgi:alpha-N-arabinofuranosidase